MANSRGPATLIEIRGSAPDTAVRGSAWQARLVHVYVAVVNGVLRTLTRVLFRKARPAALDRVERIAVYRRGTLGDLLVTLPVLQAIRKRFPRAHITFVTTPGPPGAVSARELFETGIWYDDLFYYDRSHLASARSVVRLLSQLRAKKFELFIELADVLTTPRVELRNLIAAKAMGCRFAIGFQVAGTGRFARAQELHLTIPNERDRVFSMLARDLQLRNPGSVRLHAADEHWEEVQQLLGGRIAAKSYVVIHAGGKRPLNRWFEDRFARTAEHLRKVYGVPVVLTGSLQEREICARIARMQPEGVIDSSGLLQVKHLIALMQNALLYVGNDTGPMHVAAAVGTPTVSIFSARDHRFRWFPDGPDHSVLRGDVPCSPCLREECNHDLECLKLIEVAHVTSAIDRQAQHIGAFKAAASALCSS